MTSYRFYAHRLGKGTEQTVQDSGSPTRIGDGAVARHSEAIGDQLARGLLETFAADDARSELLHSKEREAELRESVRLQIEIELPQVVMAPGGQDEPLQRLRPLQEQPQCFREGGSGIDVLLGDRPMGFVQIRTSRGVGRCMSRPFRRFLGSARYQAAAASSHSGAQMGESFSIFGLDGSMMRVRVTTGPQFTASAPKALFASRIEPVSGVPL